MPRKNPVQPVTEQVDQQVEGQPATVTATVTSENTGEFVGPRLPPRLTEMEVIVLARLAQGLSRKEAAGELHISPRTIDFHTQNIYRKYKVHNRTSAIRAVGYKALLARAAELGELSLKKQEVLHGK